MLRPRVRHKQWVVQWSETNDGRKNEAARDKKVSVTFVFFFYSRWSLSHILLFLLLVNFVNFVTVVFYFFSDAYFWCLFLMFIFEFVFECVGLCHLLLDPSIQITAVLPWYPPGSTDQNWEWMRGRSSSIYSIHKFHSLSVEVAKQRHGWVRRIPFACRSRRNHKEIYWLQQWHKCWGWSN